MKERIIIPVFLAGMILLPGCGSDKMKDVKALDNEYMHNFGLTDGTYPNQYTRRYVQQLIEGQKDTKVELMTGATDSGDNFAKLVPAVMEQARKGDPRVVQLK